MPSARVRLARALGGLGILTAAYASAAQSPDVVGKTVVFIETPVSTPVPGKLTGTGFLLADARAVCLITAQHIANSLTADTRVTLLQGDAPKTLPLRDISATDPPGWIRHEKADVAALKLAPRTEWRLHVFQRAQVHSGDTLPTRERPVMVFGFPLGLGATSFSPVSQQFNRASDLEMTSSDAFPTPAEYYFIDRPSIEGYSGAPVFHVPGQFSRGTSLVLQHGFSLVGLVAGTLSDKTGGKLGAIVPPKYVAEVFDRAANHVGDQK